MFSQSPLLDSVSTLTIKFKDIHELKKEINDSRIYNKPKERDHTNNEKLP